MIVQHPRRVAEDEAQLLRAIRPLQQLNRAAFAGQPFRLLPLVMGGHDDGLTFPEELVLRLIAKGYLVAGQVAAAWPERNIPARPFTVLLTKEGERARVSLLKHSRTIITEPRAAA
nr:hypothetical protein [Enterobacter roggenkampii]